MPLPRACRTCGTPTRTHGGRCDGCTTTSNTQREATRTTPSERGYGTDHRKRALKLRHKRHACTICGEPIDYTLHSPHPRSFCAHHLTRDKNGPIDAAHRDCNEHAGQPN